MIIVVLGMPRTGTSMMMQAIEAAGVAPYMTNHRPADFHNQAGYYEHEDVMNLRSLYCPPGMAVKMLGILAARMMKGVPARKVLMRRKRDSMFDSQEAAFGVRFPDYTPEILRLHPDAYRADYDELVDSRDFSGVASHLGLDAGLMASAVRGEMRRF